MNARFNTSNTHIVKENMDAQNIGGLQCMVWHNNNRAEEMCWSKRTKSPCQ